MKLLLVILGLFLLLLAGAGVFLVRRLKQLAASPEVRGFGESCDTDLAIPMRDCDTTRTSRRNP